jgi:hypothetical protein
MAKKKRKTKVETTLTLGDIDLDIRKAYQFIGEGKYAHARQALSRARRRLNAIRGLPLSRAQESN